MNTVKKVKFNPKTDPGLMYGIVGNVHNLRKSNGSLDSSSHYKQMNNILNAYKANNCKELLTIIHSVKRRRSKRQS